MDYMDFVNKINKIACVVSIRKNADGSYGEVINEAANRLYLESVQVKAEDYVPGKPYYAFIPRERNFEAMARKCIFEQRQIHSYVDAAYYNAWMDLFWMPLISDEEDKGYCLFSYEMNPKVESEKMADIPPHVAWQVIKMTIELRETTDFSAAMQAVIDGIREYCGAKRACLLLTDFHTRKCTVLGDSVNKDEDTPRMETYLNDEFFRIVELWTKMIAGSNCYIIQSETEMERLKEEEYEWYLSLKQSGVENFVLYPLRYNEKTIGFAMVTNFDSSRILDIKAILELTTFILASEIANQLLVKELKRISITDLLTGLLNRNAVNRRIESILNGEEILVKPYGVVFVDMNGLKKINDNKGHVFGDSFLVKAANILKNIFSDYEIYRIGGDEFVVLAFGIEKEEFDRKVEFLRSQSNEYEKVTFAIGTDYEMENPDIAKAMRLADERMYKDKEKYYQNNSAS